MGILKKLELHWKDKGVGKEIDAINRAKKMAEENGASEGMSMAAQAFGGAIGQLRAISSLLDPFSLADTLTTDDSELEQRINDRNTDEYLANHAKNFD